MYEGDGGSLGTAVLVQAAIQGTALPIRFEMMLEAPG